MHVIGIDLSGPGNSADTAVVVFTAEDARLRFERAIDAADDQTIFDLVSDLAKLDRVVVGLDAPLSYNPGGGYRPADADLSRRVRLKGRTGIMSPTHTRMAYLTLRGIALTRMLEVLRPAIDIRIVEVHPGAAMLLRDASPADVAAFKGDVAARLRLLSWLQQIGLEEIPRSDAPSDHFVAACAASLAAWQWAIARPAWCWRAQPPVHPYDFAC